MRQISLELTQLGYHLCLENMLRFPKQITCTPAAMEISGTVFASNGIRFIGHELTAVPFGFEAAGIIHPNP